MREIIHKIVDNNNVRQTHLHILLIAVMLFSASVFAADNLIRLETRANISVPVFYMKRDAATATVVLLPGGAGGFGQLVDGKPSGRNFLVRSRDYFTEAGFNVAVMKTQAAMPVRHCIIMALSAWKKPPLVLSPHG